MSYNTFKNKKKASLKTTNEEKKQKVQNVIERKGVLWGIHLEVFHLVLIVYFGNQNYSESSYESKCKKEITLALTRAPSVLQDSVWIVLGKLKPSFPSLGQ